MRKQIAEEHPDIIVNVVDAGNLERNLFLTTQLIDMNLRVVIALNMYDELQAKGDKFDYQSLSKMIGIPMIPTISNQNFGIDNLLDAVIRVYESCDYIDEDGNLIAQVADDNLLDKQYHTLNLPHKHTSANSIHTDIEKNKNQYELVRHIHIGYGNVIEDAIMKIKHAMQQYNIYPDDYTPRYIAIKLLEKDVDIESYIKNFDGASEILQVRDSCEKIIQSQMKDNIINNVKIVFVNNLNDVEVSSNIQTLIFDGFKILSNNDKYYNLDEINKLYKNQKVNYYSIYFEYCLDSVPLHYNEHKLIKKLEQLGIGRPSTFSYIVNVIQEREYVIKTDIKGINKSVLEYEIKNKEQFTFNTIENNKTFYNENNKLVPTEKGIRLIDFMTEYFNYIIDYNYTSDIELRNKGEKERK